MRKGVCSAIIGSVLLFCGVTTAQADDWMAPEPFEVVSGDGSMVFRFSPDDPFGGGQADAGVYRVGEVEELVYAVQELRSWAYPQNFFFSEDFRSFVFVPSPTQEVALEFFTDGVVVKTYRVNDLVKNRSKLTHSTSSVWWTQSVSAIPGEDTLMVTTVDGRTYSFDIATGSITEKSRDPSASRAWPYVILGAVAVGAVVLLLAALRVLPGSRRRSTGS